MHVTVSRRRLMQLLALGSSSALLAACAPQAPAPTPAPAKPTEAPKPAAPAASPAAAPAAAPAASPAAVAPAAPQAAASAVAGPAQKSPLIDQLYEAAKKEGRVVWWDTMEAPEAQRFNDAFKKAYPGIEPEVLLITADEIRVRSVAEGRAGAVSFDVIHASDQVYVEYKKIPTLLTDNTELLELAGIKREFIYEGTFNPEWTVYGASYNPNQVKESELPTDWNGFLDPKWKGKLTVESRMLTFIYATPAFGGEDKVVDYLQKLKANEPRFTRGDIAANKLLVAGEFPILLGSYLQNYWRYVPDKAPWGWVPFKEVYTGASGPGFTIPQKPPHPNAAKLFLYWLCGPEGRALSDARHTSNPLPGNDGSVAKLLEEWKVAVKVAPREYADRQDYYAKRYQEAIGLPVS
jgi:iron(III) transport system substrate-binding protein